MATPDIERLNYFERQYLSWKDFQADQSYHIEMRRRHTLIHCLRYHFWPRTASAPKSPCVGKQADSLTKRHPYRPGFRGGARAERHRQATAVLARPAG